MKAHKDFQIMGIINATPDSFSDGGQFQTSVQAIKFGKKLITDGADILDIGGESTRPNADIVSADEEINRILPIIEGLKGQGALLSVDTRNAKTMQAALNAGVDIINDVSALTHDENSLSVIKNSSAKICLMHMQGIPQTMQQNPQYENVVADVFEFLKSRINVCVQNRIAAQRILIDVGIGFGKTAEHNLELLKNLEKFHALGCDILLGTSRKSFISKLTGDCLPSQRIGGSIATILHAYTKGVRVFRVHDVFETKQALEIFSNLENK